MEQCVREGDGQVSQAFIRGDRLIINDEGYFYRTREEGIVGPYNTESEALFNLNVFIEVTQIEKSIQQDFQALVA